MAELHGRVRRVQDIGVTRRRFGASWMGAGTICALLWLGSPPTPAEAQTPSHWVNGAPTETELAALGARLGDPDAGVRLGAFRQLGSLRETALGAIKDRLSSLARARPSTDALQSALTSFRRAVGSSRADDDVDLAPGILVVTESDRSHAVAVAAEVLLILRALEAQATPAADRLIAEGLAVDPNAFAQEAVRIRNRLGVRLLPTLIAARGHQVGEIRRWASRGLKQLGMTDPATATQQGGPELLAATLRAYGSTHDLEAAAVLVSFLNDGRIQVRTAAREATLELGRNAIWKLRVAYQELTGRSADSRWNAEQTLAELCVLFDRERIEQAETALARGLNAHLAGDLLLMADQFDSALRIDPLLARRSEMAPGFAALGAARANADDLPGAILAYRRALRLAGTHADAPTWRGQLNFLSAEQSLGRGVVDMQGYQTAAALVSGHAAATDALDRLSGAWSARAERTRRIVAALAILLLSAVGFTVLRGQPAHPRQ